MEQWTRERQNTKWQFKLITNITIFAALLKNIPMGCPYSVLPFWKTILLTVFYLKKTRNLTKISCVFSAHWQCTWTDIMISTLTLLDTLQSLYHYLVMILKTSWIFSRRITCCEGNCAKNYLIMRFRYAIWRICRRTSSTKYWKVWKNREIVRFNNHISHTNDIDSFFKSFLRCSICYTFFKRSEDLTFSTNIFWDAGYEWNIFIQEKSVSFVEPCLKR